MLATFHSYFGTRRLIRPRPRIASADKSLRAHMALEGGCRLTAGYGSLADRRPPTAIVSVRHFRRYWRLVTLGAGTGGP